MPFSSSYNRDQPALHLTSGECSQALSSLLRQSPYLLAVATEASSHPSGLQSLEAQPYIWAGGGLGNMEECPLQVCLAGGGLAFGSVCVPEQCTATDLASDDFVAALARNSLSDNELAQEYLTVHTRMAQLNKFLGTGWTCGNYTVDFTIWSGLYVVLSLFLCSLTVYASRRRKRRSSLREDTDTLLNTNDDMLQMPPPDDDSLLQTIVSCWDIHTNLLQLRKRRPATACLDGLRVGSILWVILGHLMAIQSSSGSGYSNPAAFLPPSGLTTTVVGQLLFAARFAVDTFFLISGFLVVHVLNAKMPLLKQHSVLLRYLRNIPILLALRIYRILPLYGMILGLWTLVAPQLGGSGPFWYQFDQFLTPCRDFGWTNLLFVNNVWPLGLPNVETCFYHSWYLAVDIQLFLIAPLLMFWFQRHAPSGILATAILLLSSIAINMYLAYTRGWSINTFDGAAVARFDVEGYAKPHIRAQSYLMGMLLGMILLVYPFESGRRTRSQNKNLSAIMPMILALCILAGVTFITATGAYSRRPCLKDEWPALGECGSTWTSNETFFYAGTSRALWSASIAMIVYLCLIGAGAWLNALLGWPLLTPLSHLSFGVYLIHPIVIFVHQFGDRQKEPFFLSSFGLDYILVTLISFGLALIFALVVELPFANLLSKIVSRNKSGTTTVTSDGIKRTTSITETDGLLLTNNTDDMLEKKNEAYGSLLNGS